MADATRRTDPQRRNRIIDVTLDLIARNGLGGATYRTIAAAADVPLGSMTYHFATREDLVFAAFERYANDQFTPLDQAMTALAEDEDPRERLVQMIVADSGDRERDMVLLAELYVLSIRHERYAELTRRWMRRAQDAIERQVRGVGGHVVDAVQEGLGLHRYFMPEEFGEDVVRATLHALVPERPDRITAQTADQSS
jgi:DNA-binding transcriptional regulator YbjK